MKKYIIILLLTTISLNAQKFVTKYNKYMYGGKPHVWWGILSDDYFASRGGEDTQREDAKPQKWGKTGHYTVDLIPLPYFSDYYFKENWYVRHWSQRRRKMNYFPPSHATKELGPPTSMSYHNVVGFPVRISHIAHYYWFGKTTDEKIRKTPTFQKKKRFPKQFKPLNLRGVGVQKFLHIS